MPDNQRSASLGENADPSAEKLVRRLSGRYLLVLAAVAVLIAADQALVQPLMMRMNVYAPVINLAGRQRMLSQKLAKAALALQGATDEAAAAARCRELQEALSEWSDAHKALQYGSADLGVPRIHSVALDAAWRELRPHFAAMQTAARQLLVRPHSGGADDADVAVLVEHEAGFLDSMERVVALLEDEAAYELWRLRALALGVAAAILGLIVALGLLVLRPATVTIRRQVDELESRVAARTNDLNVALASLRQESERREQMEVRNRALAGQLAHADRVESLGRLATGLAHELNQPLGAIANYAEACDAVLAQPWDEAMAAKFQSYVGHVREAALRAGGIIRGIRNFVRPGASEFAAVDMGELVSDVIDLCRPEVSRQEIEFDFELPKRPVVVTADRIQIQQVLVNLVQNALQAMATSPPQRRQLRLGFVAASDEVQVDVADNGHGLGDIDSESLFSPFHTTKADGLGIGLSICRSIIEHHGGTIWAKSLPHGGAQFSFVLPLASEHAEQPVA